MTSATRKAMVDVYGTLIKAGWGEPTDQAEEPATAYELSQLERPEEHVAMAEWVVAEKLTRDQAAAAFREKTGRGEASGRKGRAEIRLEGGRKVIVSGLADDRPETILAALRQAMKSVQGRVREAVQGDEKAA
jgi:hypothetical protein